MRIGLDFDNTLALYDDIFRQAAKAQGLIGPDFAGDKTAVRNAVHRRPDGERYWQGLQGQVYGALIDKAILATGVPEFFAMCRRAGWRLFIVSHKSEFGHFDAQKINLRDAAMGWMKTHGFFDPDSGGLAKSDVHFLPTRDEKIAKIRQLDLDWFVDDLVEVLDDPKFPSGTKSILFAPGGGTGRVFQTWDAISGMINGNSNAR